MSQNSSMNNLVDDLEQFQFGSLTSEQNRSKSNGSIPKYGFKDDTSSEFFAGNLNKYKTRDELFHDLTNIKIKCLNGENLYIRKFNMPKFTARKEGNKYVCNPGFAFVTAKRPEMAEELIDRCAKLKAKGEKGIPLGDGSFVDIKPISAVKRVQANQNNKSNSLAKLGKNNSAGYKKPTRNNSNWMDNRYYDDLNRISNSPETKIDEWKTYPFSNTDFPSLEQTNQFNYNHTMDKNSNEDVVPSVFNFNFDQINHEKNYLHQVSSGSSSDPKSPIEAH